MDGARLATLAGRGFARAAARTGLPFDHYRPLAALEPVCELSRLGVVLATFDSSPGFDLRGATAHGKPLRWAITDPAALQHGDILTAGDLRGETCFVADPGGLEAPLVVRCNAVLSLLRQPAPPPGASGYRVEAADAVELLRGWPASVLRASRGAAPETALPGHVPVGEWQVMLPRLVEGVTPHNGDVLRNAAGTRFVVMMAEGTHLGWRIAARTLASG